MKKTLLVITSIIVVFALAGCKKDESKTNVNNVNTNINNIQSTNQQVIDTPLNPTYDINTTIDKMKEDSAGLVEMSDSEINQKYDLGDNASLEKKVFVNVSENNYEEIAMIKITDEAQTFNVQKALSNRVESLKEEYKNNANIAAILENSANIKIKAQDGIVTLIVSKDVDKLMQTFDSTF